MYDLNRLVSESQAKRLVKLFPTPRQKKYGRKKAIKEALLTGILQVLINGVAWEKIAWCGCSYASCFRYLKELQRRGTLKLIFQKLAKEKTDIVVGSIDTTLIPSFEFKALTGWSGKHRSVGSKVSLFADVNGLPVDVLFGRGSDNDKIFLTKHFQNVAGRRKKVVNLDMMYMNLEFRRAMRKKGIKVNMQTRAGDFRRKIGPKFKFDTLNYTSRFELERTNGWIKNNRSLRLRRSHHPAMFKAFVYMALIIVLTR